MLLNYKTYGQGGVIVLLHGMAGSLRYWDNLQPYWPQHCRVIAIDLLGFGRSPKPKAVAYDYATHMNSINETLEHIGITRPFTLVGHSMGALLALKYAVAFPQQVSQLVLIAAPIYENPQAAKHSITGGSKLKTLAYYGNTSRLLCTLWCRWLRPLSRRLAPFYLPHLSPDAAEDSVLHTWQSYSQSLHYILERQSVSTDLALLAVTSVVIIYGDQDVPVALSQVIKHSQNAKIHIFPGTHQIIHEQAQAVANLITG